MIVSGRHLLSRSGIGSLPPQVPPDNSDLTDPIVGLLGRGEKIAAVKLYRDQSGCGLKEAKEAVERIGEQNGIRSSSGTGCLGVVLLGIVVVAGLFNMRDAAKFRAGAKLRIRIFSFQKPPIKSIWTIDGFSLSLVDRLEFFGFSKLEISVVHGFPVPVSCLRSGKNIASSRFGTSFRRSHIDIHRSGQ